LFDAPWVRDELVLHLIRSYTEIPNFAGMNATYTDRRDAALSKFRPRTARQPPRMACALKRRYRKCLA